MRKALVIPILMLCGCSKSVVIDMPVTRATDTTTYTPRTKDTTNTSFVPIQFEVGVEEWKDVETEINL